MVNYHSPVTMVQEMSAYAFPPGFRACGLSIAGPLDSGARDALACHGWHIYGECD